MPLSEEQCRSMRDPMYLLRWPTHTDAGKGHSPPIVWARNLFQTSLGYTPNV